MYTVLLSERALYQADCVKGVFLMLALITLGAEFGESTIY